MHRTSRARSGDKSVSAKWQFINGASDRFCKSGDSCPPRDTGEAITLRGFITSSNGTAVLQRDSRHSSNDSDVCDYDAWIARMLESSRDNPGETSDNLVASFEKEEEEEEEEEEEQEKISPKIFRFSI